MGIVYLNGTQVGTFHPQTATTSGNIFLDITVVGVFTLAAAGNVLLNATIVGTYTALAAADFSIEANPDALTIGQNDSDTSIITITSFNAFNAAVTLSVSGEPVGVTIGFSANPITPPPNGEITSVLTITINTASVGNYILTVKGVSGVLEHTVEIALEITLIIPPQLTLGEFPLDWVIGIFISNINTYPTKRIPSKQTPTVQKELFTTLPRIYEIQARVTTDGKHILSDYEDDHAVIGFIDENSEEVEVVIEKLEIRYVGWDVYGHPWLANFTLKCINV